MSKQAEFKITSFAVILSPAQRGEGSRRFFALRAQNDGARSEAHRNDGCNVLFIVLSTLIFVFGWNMTCFAEDSRNPQDWHNRARDDFEVAQFLFEQTDHYAAVCFHAHQAVEKALKGALISHDALPGKFHYTAELAESFSAFDPEAANFVDGCKELDQVYVSSRYPKSDAVEFTREAASQCIENAKPVVDFVSEKTKVEPQMELVD